MASVSSTFTLTVTPPTSLSPDGSTITGGAGTLVTVHGTWTFGAPDPSRGNTEWSVSLNGIEVGILDTLQVANGGHMYGHSHTFNSWYLWQGNGWLNDVPAPPAPSGDPHSAPPQAVAVGYTYETFSDGPWELSSIDINNTKALGKKWYVDMNWPRAADTAWHTLGITPPGDLSISSGNLVFAPQGPTITPGHSGNIFTICPIDTPPYYQGTTFVGGYYIEVLATWPRSEQSNLGEGSWPDAWTFATSFLTNTGNVSFEWTEVDIFEAPSGQNVHLWTHTAGQSTSSDSYSSYNPDGIAHSGTKYGMLLVPSQSGNPPRMDLYVNDVLKHTFSPPAGRPQAIFDFMANDRQCLILGAGQANPMTIQSVRVWQRPPSGIV